jgi:hypothetical protein
MAHTRTTATGAPGVTPGVTPGIAAVAVLSVLGVVGLFLLSRVSAPGASVGGGVLAAAVMLWLVVRTSARPAGPADSSRAASPAGFATATVERWTTAVSTHDSVLEHYGAWELDPEKLLRFPALWDLSLPVNQDFHDALERAGQLRTENIPGDRRHPDATAVDAYVAAVSVLSRAWRAAEQNARRTGVDDLSDALQGDADRALKLLRHADAATTPAEESSYLAQASKLMHRLADRGVIPANSRAVADLEARSLPAIGRD